MQSLSEGESSAPGWPELEYNPGCSVLGTSRFRTATRPEPSANSVAIARQRIHLPPSGWRSALTGALSGSLWEGDAVSRLEWAFADFIGTREAVTVPSGRAGLRFIYEALELEEGSEIVFSAFAYPVVPHLAKSLGYDVKFADCELETLGMDPDDLERVISDRTSVVLVTHLYGVPARIREIREIADAHGAAVIEDCAHCYGASVGGRKAGAFGRFGYFSFETSKPINTMGGGMVTTDDPELAARLREIAARESTKGLGWLAKRLSTTTFEAIVTHPLAFNLGVYPALRLLQGKDESDDRFASGYHADEITMQGRMGRYTNYQAKLGLRQTESAVRSLEKRVANAERLMEPLADRVRFQRATDPDVESNYMLVTALFPEMETVARELLKRGVDSKHHYMRDCSHLLDGDEAFPRAARAESEILHLPAYPELSERQIDHVSAAVAEVLETLG